MVYYLHEGYPTAILAIDITIVICNLLGLLMMCIYQKYIALYSNIRSMPPPSNQPSYGPEVRGASQAWEITGGFQDVAVVPEEEVRTRRGQKALEVSSPPGLVGGGAMCFTLYLDNPLESFTLPYHPGDAGVRRGDGNDHTSSKHR